jgi:hypothetical protein
MNKNNSLVFQNVSEGQVVQHNILGDQCYSCWYFIKIKVNDSNNANYRLTIS